MSELKVIQSIITKIEQEMVASIKPEYRRTGDYRIGLKKAIGIIVNEVEANEVSTSHEKALDIDFVSESFKLVKDMVNDSKMWYEEFGEPENGEYKASFVDGEGFLGKYSR